MASITAFARRHVRPLIGTGVATAFLAVGGIAYAANSSAGAPPLTAAAPASVPAAATSTAGAANAKGRLRIARGTITAMDGSTWTVRTARGLTLTVTVTSKTRFGTKAAPSAASSFHVGSPIAVAGRRTGTTSVTARRIWVPHGHSKTTAA